jgi:NADP-dependent 3-hydroxy acid dehydrogenase YdfG
MTSSGRARRYMVTGASGGIGHEVARLLTGRGHQVFTVFRPSNLSAGTPQPGFHPIAADLADAAGVEAALQQAGIDALDGVVHCAGAIELGTVAETSGDAWTTMLTTNVTTAALVTKTFLPQLRESRGRVVFVNSGQGLRVNPGWTAYAASKHALRALADGLRAEEPTIRVTSVYPGRTATGMQRRIRDWEGAAYEPEQYSDPLTVAQAVLGVLELPADSTITDLTIRPA